MFSFSIFIAISFPLLLFPSHPPSWYLYWVLCNSHHGIPNKATYKKKKSIKIKVSLYKLKKKKVKKEKVNAATNDHMIMPIEKLGPQKKRKSQQVKLLLDIDDMFN